MKNKAAASFICLLVTARAISCGGGAGRAVDVFAEHVDAKEDLVIPPFDPGKEIGLIEIFETAEISDATQDIPQLKECDEPGDCPSGFCIDVGGGNKYCAPTCLEGECPPGWECTAISGTGTDVIFICMPRQNYLCRPCKINDDRSPAGINTGAICIEYGPQVRFCGRDCASSVDSRPENYSCVDVTIRSVGTFKQCMPNSGVCECIEDFVVGGYETICYDSVLCGLKNNAGNIFNLYK